MQKLFKTLRILKDIFPFFWTKQDKIHNLCILSFALIIISIALDLNIPFVLKKVVSKLASSEKHMSYQLTLLLVAYGIIWIASQTIQQLRHIIIVKPLERGIRLFCSKLFDHLHSLPMSFHLNRKTGAITNYLELAQHGISNVFWGLFLFVVPTIIELILASSVLCYCYGTIYGLILIIIVTVFIGFTLYATGRASYFQHLSNEQKAKTNANIVDSLLNFASIKYFNNKAYEVLKCDHHLKEREKLSASIVK